MRGSSFDLVSTEMFNRRLRVVTLCVIVIFTVLGLRLWFLQIISGPTYRRQSESNRIHLQDIPPFRGLIYDRSGALLVDNRPSYDVYIVPEEVENRERLIRSLQMLIGLDPLSAKRRLRKDFSRYPFKPILVKKNISRSELAVVETNLFNLPGVMIQVKPQRYYRMNGLASHLIGYLGEISERQLNSGKYYESKAGDLIGKYGVEGEWQEFLNGVRGGEQVEVDAAGRRLRVLSRRPPTPGLNLALTIDKNLQFLAEKRLTGKKGAIVAMNPNNGEILALASSPGFDPNVFIGGMERAKWESIISDEHSPLQNRVVSGLYPPGSVFKIVVALAGLEEGVIDPGEEVICTGKYTVGNRSYQCWKEGGHGRVSLHKALVESCDVYFYTLGRLLGVDRIAQYARMFGLGRKTGFDLGYEREGLIPTSAWKLKRWGVPWQGGETVSTAIGQGFVLVTPIQMVRVISAVFNGGQLHKPKAIKWVGKDERRVYQFTPTLVEQMEAKEGNVALIRKALTGVVHEPRGTGRKARVKGIRVAGKTGTAQLIALEKREDLEKRDELPVQFRDHAWFVAIAPVESPALALAILIEHGGHGGSAAAPIAKEIITAHLGKSR